MAYTPEQYAEAGQWILKNFDNPELVASTARQLGISVEDLTRAAQTVAPAVTQQDVINYLERAEEPQPAPAPAPAPAPVVPNFSYLNESNLSSIPAQELAKLRGYLGTLYTTNGMGISPSERNELLAHANRFGIRIDLLDDLISQAFKGYGGDPYSLADINDIIYGGRTFDQITPTKPIVPLNTAGKAFTGENTGLRGPYVPFAEQMLQRVSSLMAARQDPNYKPETFGSTYGQDTAKTLQDLQTRRESMMATAKPYTPYNYSFAPDTKSAAKGGVMSLVDHYDAGGAVGNTYTAQTVPSTFTAPTDGFSSSTYTSGYTAPTNMYTGPGATGITAGTGTFDTTARDRLMNPYMSGVVDPATREAKRQSEIQGMTNAAKFTQAGAFGGTRNILAEAERQRNLNTQIGDIYGRGQKEAYEAAQKAFEAEQGRALTAGVESERARQEAGRQGLSSAQTAAQLGLDASKLSEQSKQFGAQYGLNVASTSAQYDQAARQLQQQAEEAQARGDQFAANLALQQLQEANRAAEASRDFEYKQSRDQYLDPFREAGYMSQVLGGLPIQAGSLPTSSGDALKSLLASAGILFPGG